MSKVNYLNVGCGNKHHKDWTNVDMTSTSPYVKKHNVLKGLPYQSNRFEVVYHSQVLEHIPREKAYDFLRECFRVLRPGGIIRIVVPDIEDMAREYLRLLQENLENPTKLSQANYDWILLEMYDQTVRNYGGGQMAEFLRQQNLINEEYVTKRSGYVARKIIEDSHIKKSYKIKEKLKRVTVRKLFNYVLLRLKRIFMTEASKIGSFRLGGEVHMWMYDRFSLTRLLAQVGFEQIEVVTPHKSRIPNWSIYELDVKDDMVYDPTALFIEAIKPIK